MREMFFWMLDAPAGNPVVAQQSWEDYLDSLAITTLETVAIAAVVAIAVYCIWSRRIRIVNSQDLFKPYWPMLVLLNCFPAAGFAVYTVLGSYEDALGADAPGQFMTSVQVSAVCLIFTFLVTLLALLGIPPLTPPAFRGRPWRAMKWLFPWTWDWSGKKVGDRE